jgi:hypothetical protein
MTVDAVEVIEASDRQRGVASLTLTFSQADRELLPRSSANDTGDITQAANTLVTSPAWDAKFGPAQRG